MSSATPPAELAGLDPSRVPAHVAIIMDGNGRWARSQGQDRLFGHYQGYRTLKNIVYAADELRLSNFLLWETAYSEIYVTPTCWPDFDRDQLIAALADYQKRVRRFGAVIE